MNNDEILKIFRTTGALLEGHFILTSGRHSPSYFQCAKVLQYPEYLTIFASAIVDEYKLKEVDTVIAPAVGGIVIGTEVGRQLGVRTIFAEREDGRMKLRRGFEINNNENVLVVEDVITTGGSVTEVLNLVQTAGGKVVGLAVIVDRSDGKINLHDRQFSILRYKAVSYEEHEIPAELRSIPVKKPGSRDLK
jgi:orotate phosphoribosyltransferase